MKYNKRKIAAAGQLGFMLLEMALSLLVFSVILGIRMRNDYQDLLDLKATNAGKTVAKVQSGLNDTISSYYDLFVNMHEGEVSPIDIKIGVGANEKTITISDGFHPTIQNLIDLGKLPQNFRDKTAFGGSFKIELTKVPSGCVAPNCNIDGIVVLDSPFTIAGVVDEARLGIAIRSIGVDGGGTSNQNKSLIKGHSGQWNSPLPAGITPAKALIAARAGYSSAMWANFFRIDGSRWMTGDGNFGGHSLVNVKEVMATLKNVDDSCTAAENGAFASGVINGYGTVMVCSNGKWKIQNGVIAAPGSPCAPEGSTATSDVNGEQLVCKKGVFVKLVSLISRNVEVGRVAVSDGSVVSKPACDVGGVPDYSLHMNRLSVDVTIAPPKQAQYISAVDSGGGWTILLRLRDDTGGEVSGNIYGLSAVMKLECKY